MHTVGAFEAKTHLSQLLDQVQRTGEPVLVQKRGRNVAVIEPYGRREGNDRRRLAETIIEAFRQIRGGQAASAGETIEALVEEGRLR